MVMTVQETRLKPGYKQTEVGVMPEDWEVKQVGEIANKFFNGGTPSTQKSEYWSGNIPWITGADIVNQRIDVIRRYITDEAVKNSSTNIIEEGNLLLVTRTGVGKMTIAPFDLAISQDITGIYLTLTRIHDGWYFLHPARLPVVRLDGRVEAVCPEAFSAEADVSLCPRVHATAFSSIVRAAV